MYWQSKFDRDHSRQRALRRLARDARLDALKAVGVPDRPDVPTEPADRRWQALIDQAHAALETASDEMETYLLGPGNAIGKDSRAIGDRSGALMAILMALDELLDG